RHTRFSRDWSSRVLFRSGEVRVDRTIEIDRHEPPPQKPLHLAREEPKPAIARRVVAALGRWDIGVVAPNRDYLDARIDPLRVVRSEERRVGKEWRTGSSR